MKHLKLFFALFAILALGVGNAWGAEYELVTSEPSDWSGEYLVVYNKGCFNGSLTTGFDKSAPVAVTISNNKINLDEKYAMIIGKQGTAYSLKTASGYYIGRESSSSNGMDASQTWSTKYTINFTWDATKKTVKIAGKGGKCLGLNSTTWRFYASSNTYVNLSLYKKVESGSTEPALTSIQIDGELTNKTYEEGDELDLTGLTVLANYESGDPKDVTNEVEWSYTPNPLTKGTTSVEVTATYNKDKTATTTITGLTVNEHVITPGEYCTGTLGYAFWGLSAEKLTAVADEVNYTRVFNDITINIKNGQKANAYFKSDHTRVYSGGYTMTFSVPNGYIITDIAFTASGNNWEGDHTANVGTMSDTKNWTGANQNVTITFNGTSRIASVCVTYKADVKYALTITEPEAGTGTLVVKDGENTLASGAEIYESTKLTVTATPETGYEEGVVVVKNASDEDVTADVYDAGTLTMPAYAVTISATFEKKPCTLLTTPVVNATSTYNSATLTWAAVANAAKYSVTVGETTTEVTEPTFTATGLNAETTYTYQVQAIAEAEQDTYCDSEVAEGSFTTDAAPVATLTLSDIEGTTTKTGALNGTITLPTTAAECSKTFVGWDADENCDHAPTYAPGAEYTFTIQYPTLYAVYADGEGGGNFTITKTMSKIVSDNGYTVSSGSTVTCYTSLTLDENITLSTTGSANCGSFWSDPQEWRLYQNKSGNAIVTATNGCSLTSVKFTFSYSNTGTLLNNGAAMKSGTAVSASGTSATYTVGNSGSATNGQIRITAIEVSYSKEGEYSNYSTTCAAAPIATIDPTSVTATAAGAEGKVTVTYENVNTEHVAVLLFNDAACTEAFTAGWLTASIGADENITYTVAENTTYAERKAYIKLTAPETTGATDPDVVVIPVTQAGKDKVFASLEELLANITPTTTATKVTVTLTKEPIADIYVSGTYRNGIYLNVPYQGSTKKIEIYSKNVPAEWVVGGSVSGTLTNCDWQDYNGTWELCPADWSELTYQEPKAVSTVVVSGTPTKTTYVDGEAFDPAGLTVTVNYNDATTETNPTGVTFNVTPATLVKGQTSVSVTATFNSVTSAAYEVTGLTVNDIPTKTIADFIEARGTRCYLEGIVSGLTEGNSMKYGNFDLTDASATIYVYGCLNAAGESQKFADLGVKNGDKIKVIADEYELYGGTKDEAKNVQYVSHISAASITIANITMEVGETKTIAATVVPAEAEVTYTIKENAANAISLNDNTITALAEGTATITATVAEGATYLGNSVDFTVTVGPKTESEEVVILAEHNGQWYALTAETGSSTNSLAALEVEYFNGVLYNVDEEDKASITWKRTIVGNFETFQYGDKYLKGSSSTNLFMEDGTEGKYQWDKDTHTMLIGSTKRTFLYQGTYFKNYAISNAGRTVDGTTYSALPVVTAPVYATGDVVYTRTVTNGNYGTICLPYASSNYTGMELYEVSWLKAETGLYLDQLAAGAQLVAGKPYIFRATSTEIKVTCTGDAEAAPVAGENGLTGTFTDIADGDAALLGNYIIAQNQIWVAGANTSLPAYRAYINKDDVPTNEQAKLPGRRRVCMGENTTTDIDNITNGENTTIKVIENGQLIIIRNGEKFNAQGIKL